MRVLVVGATGMLGEPVARRLRQDGHEVRVLARDPDAVAGRFGNAFEIVAGDVTRVDTLAPALSGCEGLHINLRGHNTVTSYREIEQEGVKNLAQAAAAAGIERISYVSGAGDEAVTASTMLGRIKSEAAAAIRACGVGHTVFKPTHFMESLPKFIWHGRATVIGNQPHRYHYLAAADFARMVSKSFSVPDAANKTLTILGPDAFTMLGALRVYCESCRPDVPVGVMPIWGARMLGILTGNRDLRFAAMLFAGFRKMGESGDPGEANALLGAPVITLPQWCAQQASVDDC